MIRSAVLISGLLLACLMGTAHARLSATWDYPVDVIFSTTVRFVRVDRGCTVTDKDPQTSYVLFECRDGKQVKRGAVEIFKTGERVRLQVTLSDEPMYLEQRFLDLLSRKLREEQGYQMPRSSSPAPDGGA